MAGEKKTIKSLFSDSIVYGLSGALSKFIAFLLIPLYTQYLAPAEYGLLAISTSFSGFLLVLATFGLDSTVYRFFFDTEDENKRKLVLSNWIILQFCFTILISGVLIGFYDILGDKLLNSGDTTVNHHVLNIIIVSLFLNILPSVINAYFRLKRLPWHAMGFTAVTSLISIACGICFVKFLKLGAIGVLGAQALSFLVGTLVAAYFLRNSFDIKSFKWRESIPLVKYGSGILPASLVNIGLQFFINILLQTKLTKAELGLFFIGNSFASVLTLLTTSFASAWSPFSFSLIKDPDFLSKMNMVHRLYVYLIGFFVFLIFIFSLEALQIFTNASYYSASWIIGLQAFSIFIGSLSVFYVLGMAIVKEMKLYAIFSIVSSVFILLSALVLVKPFGKEGIAVATLIGQFMFCTLLLWKSQRKYFIFVGMPKLILVVVGFFLAACVVRFFETDNLMLNLLYKAVCCAIVFVLVWSLSGISKVVRTKKLFNKT